MKRLMSAEKPDDGTIASVRWEDDFAARFHAVWLRDNALDPATRSASNAQRPITLQDIPADTTIADASVSDDMLSDRFVSEEKTVVFPSGRLQGCYADKDGLLSTLSVLEQTALVNAA